MPDPVSALAERQAAELVEHIKIVCISRRAVADVNYLLMRALIADALLRDLRARLGEKG